MRRFTLIAALLLAVACSKPPEPSSQSAPPRPATPPPAAAEAAQLVGNSAEFSEFEFTNAGYSLPLERANRSEPAQNVAEVLQKEGWLAMPGGSIALTEKSRADKRFLLRQNGILDVVPLAKKEMGTVSAVTANADGTATAAFTWRWEPNEVGTPLAAGPLAATFGGVQNAKATLIWDGTSWSVLKIER